MVSKSLPVCQHLCTMINQEGEMIGRSVFLKFSVLGAASAMAIVGEPAGSQAVETQAPDTAPFLADYTDSRGIFRCRLPTNFLRTERKKDKRGTVFVCGDYNKAEVVSIQLINTVSLLSEAGLPAFGDFATWESLGTAQKAADLLKFRRDQDAAGNLKKESEVIPSTVSLKGDTLEFMMRSQIPVQRPDLLLQDQGVSELFRNTYVKAIMRGDGTFAVIWSGALSTDWNNEGGAKDKMKAVADSFQLEGLVVNGIRLGPSA
ncbi:unnamed protein product [Choristocarpus tenellus]